MRTLALVVALLAAAVFGPTSSEGPSSPLSVVATTGLDAQQLPPLRIEGPGGEVRRVEVSTRRGYAAVDAAVLVGLGRTRQALDELTAALDRLGGTAA